MRRVLLAVAATVVLPCPASAWNVAGHMVSGALAYNVLKAESPESLAKVVALLRKHPEYESRWAHQLTAAYVPEGERDLYLFMLAARWADDVRKAGTYNHPSWHYVDYPFKPGGQPADLETPTPDPDNILRGFAVNWATLTGNGPDADRTVALAWLFHLVGDVHQPLHTCSLVTTDRPPGDKGGNQFYIRSRESGRIIGLH